MIIKYSVAELKATAERRQPGWVDFVLSRGKIEGDIVVVDDEMQKALRRQYPTPSMRPALPEPSWGELATNFAQAIGGWAKAGFPVAEREIYEKRSAICLTCEYWRPKARGGLGKCKICHCSKFKIWLATSRCPHQPPKW